MTQRVQSAWSAQSPGRRKLVARLCAVVALAMLGSLILALGSFRTSFAATFIVNSAADTADFNVGDGICETAFETGVCTLRAAIQEANFTPAADLITFNIAGAGVQTISPTSALPTITAPVTIDGYSQAGSSANTLASGSNAVLLIELNGTLAGFGSHGLTISGGGSTIKGLVINRFNGHGVRITTSGGNTIEGNFIGTNAVSAELGNGSDGVRIDGSPNNVIGGTSPAARNVISANESDGVELAGTGATGNRIEGNLIGTNVAGTSALGNWEDGVYTLDSRDNTIGGTTGTTPGGACTGACNVISGQGDDGIDFDSSDATGNTIAGNFIGLNAAGTAAIDNDDDGIDFDGANNNTIGGDTPAARNVISGNGSGQPGDGIEIKNGSSGNVVQGNYIGLNSAGTAAIPNAFGGVFFEDAGANIVGGVPNGGGGSVEPLGQPRRPRVRNGADGRPSALGNVISGNGTCGVCIEDFTDGVVVQGNLIGTDPAGTGIIGNDDDGVFVLNSDNNLIGGTTPESRNIISGNGDDGVQIQGSLPSAPRRPRGPTPKGAGDNRGGGRGGADDERSGGQGARSAGIRPSQGTGNTIQGNYIGLDVTGTVDLGNQDDGVFIVDASNNLVGGTAEGARNIISGNGDDGVNIQDFGTDNRVEGNYIGTDVSGTLDRGNDEDGVLITESGGNIVGGTATGAGNVISGNGLNGVNIADSFGNLVQGNLIGTNAAGTSALGNDLNGVLVRTAATANAIGEFSGFGEVGRPRAPGARVVGPGGNLIAFNGENGVLVLSGSRNTILSNEIHTNGQLGIDLDADGAAPGDGVTPNDTGDPDTGANNLQNFPVLTSASSSGGNTTILGSLNSTADAQFLIQFFSNTVCDTSLHGEGETFLGSTVVTTAAAGASGGTAVINAVLPVSVPPGRFITSTATSQDLDTSEFSACVVVTSDTTPTPTPTPTETPTPTPTFTPTSTPTPTITPTATPTPLPGSCFGLSATEGFDFSNSPRGVDLRIKGRAARDSHVIVGSRFADKIYIIGGRGNDVVCAGEGNDHVKVGGGNDRVDGGPGNDLIEGGSGDDELHGGPGDDTIHGQGGNDNLFGEDGDDHLNGGGQFADHCDGGPGSDVISNCRSAASPP